MLVIQQKLTLAPPFQVHHRGQKDVCKGIVQRCIASLIMFFSCIIDGMDQVKKWLQMVADFGRPCLATQLVLSFHSQVCFDVQWKTYLPWQPGASNSLPSFRLKQKVTGVYFHGLILAFYLTCPWTSGDPDLNCTAIHHTLWLISQQLGDARPLSPHWFLQVSEQTLRQVTFANLP